MTVLARRLVRLAAIPARLADYLTVVAAVSVDLLVWSADNQLRDGGSAPVWLVPAGSTATLAALLLRRRFPAAVLIVQLVWATACGAVFEQYTPTVGLLVALYTVARQRPPARSLPWWTVCLLPYATYAQDPSLLWYFTGLLVLMLIAGAAWLLGYRAWLDQRAAERQVSTARAVQAERLRIARELHDIVAHAVSVMVLQAAGARAVLASDPHRAEAALDVVQDVGKQSMNELRRLLGLLRSASAECDLTDAGQQPDLDGIDALLVNTRAAGMTVSKHVHGTAGLLDPSVGLTAYRVVQEALTNALKHAGPDPVVRLELAWAPHCLTITVHNDAPPPGRRAAGAGLSTGHGLLGLRERVHTVGGSLDTGPTPTGFRVEAVLPVATRLPAGRETAASATPQRIVS